MSPLFAVDYRSTFSRQKTALNVDADPWPCTIYKCIFVHIVIIDNIPNIQSDYRNTWVVKKLGPDSRNSIIYFREVNKATIPSGFLGGIGFTFIIWFIIMLLLLLCTSNRIKMFNKLFGRNNGLYPHFLSRMTACAAIWRLFVYYINLTAGIIFFVQPTPVNITRHFELPTLLRRIIMFKKYVLHSAIH